jgi:putative transposase
MTTRWRPEFDPNHLNFVTTKAVKVRHLFQRDIAKRIIVDSLYTSTIMNKTSLYAFVVMPNHIHVLIQCTEKHQLDDWARTVKSTVARLLVRYHQVEGNDTVLAWMAAQVTRPKKQQVKVWEDSYLAKSVVTADFMLQKLKYIHENPVQPNWGLVESPAAYPWSSAAFYEGGPCLIPVTNAYSLLG